MAFDPDKYLSEKTGAAPGLLVPGNIDLGNRPVVKNSDGSISTVRSFSTNIDGREVLLPTVTDDGKIVSEKEAVDRYLKTGKHLGIFDTPDNATAAAKQIHEDQAKRYLPASTEFNPDHYLAEKTGDQPGFGARALEAAFPGATQDRTPVQGMAPFYYAGMPPELANRMIGTGEQRAKAAVGDALSLPTRAAGTLGGLLGYQGATGGKQGLEALADPETGLARPLREKTGAMVREGYQGGPDGRTIGDYAKMGAGGLGYMAASVAEDPTAWLGVASKPASAALSKTLAPAESGFAKGSKAFAQRLVQRDYMPLRSDLKAGWSADNAIKHGLYGRDVGKLAEDGTAKLADLYKQQKALIQAGKAAGGRVDFQQAIDATLADIEKGPDSELWDKAPKLAEEYKRRIARIRDLKNADPKDISAALNKDVADAQLVKSDVGEDAAFASKKGTPGIDPEAATRGRFAAILYGKTKDQIEKETPEGLREINKAMSEIIPLRNAAEYRSEVLGRQRIGKLTDFILGGSAIAMPKIGIPAMVLKKFVDSPKFTAVAGKLQEYGEKMAAARSGSESSFYAAKLRALGLTAAEVDALKSGVEAAQPANAIPFRKVAEDDAMNQPQARK